MSEEARPLPVARREDGLDILKGLAGDRSLLTALTLMNNYVGKAFQITLFGFRPAVFIGPQSDRQLLVTDRSKLKWRPEGDPVTRLLRRGILVVDDEEHDALRGLMDPPLQRRHVIPQIGEIWRYTNDVLDTWRDGDVRDMLVEMRRAALLILMGCLFKIDFAPDMARLWQPILHLLEYISPGFWILWPDMPRPSIEQPSKRWTLFSMGSFGSDARH